MWRQPGGMFRLVGYSAQLDPRCRNTPFQDGARKSADTCRKLSATSQGHATVTPLQMSQVGGAELEQALLGVHHRPGGAGHTSHTHRGHLGELGSPAGHRQTIAACGLGYVHGGIRVAYQVFGVGHLCGGKTDGSDAHRDA